MDRGEMLGCGGCLPDAVQLNQSAGRAGCDESYGKGGGKRGNSKSLVNMIRGHAATCDQVTT